MKIEKRLPVKRWILLILCGIISGILLMEVLLRIRFDDVEVNGSYWGTGAFEESDGIGYRHASGFRGRAFRRGAFDSYVEISPEGLRQKNLQMQLKLSRKVLFVGDSYTFGLGVPEESTFVSLMQARLNSLGIGIINGGQTGYCTDQEVLFAKQLIAKFNPDLAVLILFSGNDIEGNFLSDYRNVDVRYGIRLKKNRLLRGLPFDFMRTHAYVWRYLDGIWNRYRSKKIHRAYRKLASKEPQRVLQSSIQALKNFQQNCRSAGVQPALVIIDSRIHEKIFGRSLQSALVDLQIPILELPESHFDKNDYFELDHHWNANGHRKAEDSIRPFVEKLLNSLEAN